MLSAKTSWIGCEPNRTSRTGYELNRISRIASEPSRRFLYTAAIEESTSTAARRHYRSAGGVPMDCLKCKNLEESFESRLGKYFEARSAAYHRVSTELAAKKYVDMENAKYDLEEHRLVCASAVTGNRLHLLQ
jgi:hypothetical protein